MSQFDAAIPFIFKHEGGFADDSKDPGGATNRGISLRFLKSLIKQKPELINQIDLNGNDIVDKYDIQRMDIQKATDLYLKEWWDKYKYGSINDQKLATKLFDLSVNMGPSQAAKLFQRAYCKVTGDKLLPINGVLSNDFFECINKLDQENMAKILLVFSDLAADFYKMLAKKRPVFNRFLGGWLKRVYDHDV